jgi:hypothetical protein
VTLRDLTRRQFLAAGSALAGLATTGFSWLPKKKHLNVPGAILGASSSAGHKLRDGAAFPPPSESIEKETVIIGGGIAGLSAAWKLHKSGYNDFLLLELEKNVGGNAHYGQNEVSAYPWGAHYVPLLTEESAAARELFADLGIITGTENGLPVYNDYYLSADPQDRLYMHGRWHEGIVPQTGIKARDRAQYKSFFAKMDEFKNAKGKDGRRAFAIPLDQSSADAQFRDLDRISMAAYLQQNSWDSTYLKWYVDYCCRDDYGATMGETSAWAGIHYFAARNGKAANAMPQTLITWPEGNGWIVRELENRLAPYLHTQALAYAVREEKGGVRVQYWDMARNKTVEIRAKTAIMAAPRFIAERLYSSGIDTADFSYSPWMVANITLDALPQGKGMDLCWDNMIYDSKLLGYVMATHQNLNHVQNSTVLTYYWPLSHLPPAVARKEAISRSYEEWRYIVLTELLRVHPELDGHVKHMDVWLWGHGMIRPTPGFIWGDARQKALKQAAPVFHAHSDMSGISIFEEANTHGVQAAEALMAHHRHKFVSSL